MTVKNFIKTTVLGIAFCSVFGMSNSMGFQREQFHRIIDKLIYHDNLIHDCYLLKSPTINLTLYSEEFEDFIEDKLLEIMNIIRKALHNNVNVQDVTQLVNNIEDLKNTPYSDVTDHKLDIEKLLKYSDQIIQKVQNNILKPIET